MQKNRYKGKFIVVEGIDGSGSTTQAEYIHQFLRLRKMRSHRTNEPTNYLIGGLIRSWLTGDWSSSPECLQLLFTADRAHHIEKEIIPLLKKGVSVVCDRYWFSTIAYGALDIPNTTLLEKINKQFLQPDIVLYVRVSPKEAMRRLRAGRNSFELFEKEKQLMKVAKEYARFAKKLPYFITVNGEQEKERVADDIRGVLSRKFKFRSR